MLAVEASDPLYLLNRTVFPGERVTLHLPLPSFSPHLPASIPVMVIRGEKPGPRLCITGAIHGDEVIGIEIITRLLGSGSLTQIIAGDILLLPVVNIFGMIQRGRYLPDRKDLNRSFPGSSHGSIAARVANLLLEQVVTKCTHLIDLHSGAMHRYNLPQIRIARTDDASLALAKIFKPPLILQTDSPSGSLRHMAMQRGMPSMVFEGSEAERFDESAAEAGWQGIARIMASLGMIAWNDPTPDAPESFVATTSKWLYAPEGGIFRSHVSVGETITAGDVIGSISDIFGQDAIPLQADVSGILIGRSLIPVIHEGDALFHIAYRDGVSDIAPQDVNPPPMD